MHKFSEERFKENLKSELLMFQQQFINSTNTNTCFTKFIDIIRKVVNIHAP